MNKEIKLSKTQVLSLKKMVETGKSFYQETKALLETDLDIRSLFLTKTVKEIAITIYGDLVTTDPAFAITKNRERTPLGNAIHNLKRLCKSLYTEKRPPATVKKYDNVLKDLSSLGENFNSYRSNEQDSILNQIESLITTLNKSLPKEKAIKIK